MYAKWMDNTPIFGDIKEGSVLTDILDMIKRGEKNKMRYKIGDKVKVSDNVTSDIFKEELRELKGKIFTISEVDGFMGSYKVKENDWDWRDDMLEPVGFIRKDIKFGDVIINENGEKFLALNNQYVHQSSNPQNVYQIYDDMTIKGKKITKIKRASEFKKIYDSNQILDEKEKEYLNNLIKPFRKKVINVVKENTLCEIGYEYIKIKYEDYYNYDYIYLPPFKKNIMYKGMILNKEYSLKELGLE